MAKDMDMSDWDEWRAEVTGMSEHQRYVTEMEVRHSMGMCGDREDAEP